jgi:outer membrane protein TolC
LLLAVAAGLGVSCALGCVSSSIDADVGRVRELTRVERLPHVADTDVDPAADDDARRLLAQPLDADAAVRVALLNNRELRATLREMGIARGRLIQAGLLPNPRAEAELLPERASPLELRVEYDITRAVLAPMRAHAAAPELEAARYRAAAAVVELGYRVRIAFYRLQSAEQRLAVAQQVLEGLAASRDAARAMLAAGNVAALNVASEEAAYERARITGAKLELEVATERERVQRLIGAYGDDTKWSVRGELPPVPERASTGDTVEARALRASLELRQTRQRLLGLARRAGVTRTEGWLPDIALDVHGLQPEANASPAMGHDWRFGGGANVSVPLFDRNQGTVTALQAERDALLERYYGMVVEIRSAAREAQSRVTSSLTRARLYQDVIVPAQLRVTEQTLLQYNAMQLGVFQLLAARREQLDVQLAYVETLREYWSSVAELDALLAGKRVGLDDGGAAKATDGQADPPEGP